MGTTISLTTTVPRIDFRHQFARLQMILAEDARPECVRTLCVVCCYGVFRLHEAEYRNENVGPGDCHVGSDAIKHSWAIDDRPARIAAVETILK